jgi:radical SAM superfamily enzyme YgiQ (UPF0313 family)
MALDLLVVNPGASHGIYGELGNSLIAVEPPLWCRILAAHARDKGYSVDILDAEACGLSGAEAAAEAHARKPRLVCVAVYGHQPSASTQQMWGARQFCMEFVPLSSTPVVMVGGHPSALPRLTIEEEAVDYVAMGEGPATVEGLLAGHDEKDIPGLVWSSANGDVNINKAAPLFHPDDLHGNAWDLLPMDRYRAHNWQCFGDLSKRQPYASVFTSLGCPYRCSFCLREGTTIVTAKGKNKKIEDLVVGDKLLAWDEQKKEIAETTISQTASRIIDRLIRITASSGEVIEVTAEHPIYTQRGWVEAGEVTKADRFWVMETRDKMRFQMRTNNPAKKMTPEWRGRISAATRGLKRSAASRIRYRYSKLGDKNPMKRKEISMAPALRAFRSDRMKELWSDPQRAAAFNATRPVGEDHHNWQGGISRFPWPLKFNNALKKRIRQRDDETCQECGVKAGLTVHHVDYDKENCDECNLITLCRGCNSRANFNRTSWRAKFSEMLSARGQCPSFKEIADIQHLKGEYTVYNFECSPHDNYWAERILVHNCCINAPFDSNKYRMRSPERVIYEIEGLHRYYGVDTFKITDEMFVLNEKHYTAICEGLIESGLGKRINIWAYARVDTVKPDTLALLRRAGIQWLALGIESGSAHVRDGAMKKLRQSDIIGTVRTIQDAGINVIGNFMFGLRDDDEKTMRATLDLAIQCRPDFANFYSTMAYPGSGLYAQAVKEGWTLPETWRGYSQHNDDCRPLDTEHVSGKTVLAYRDAAFRKFFSDRGYLDHVFDKFGEEAEDHVHRMLSYRLKRKLLEAA